MVIFAWFALTTASFALVISWPLTIFNWCFGDVAFLLASDHTYHRMGLIKVICLHCKHAKTSTIHASKYSSLIEMILFDVDSQNRASFLLCIRNLVKITGKCSISLGSLGFCLSTVWDSGQIIAPSHGFSPQKVAFWKGNPLISRKSWLVKYCNLARWDEFSLVTPQPRPLMLANVLCPSVRVPNTTHKRMATRWVCLDVPGS